MNPDYINHIKKAFEVGRDSEEIVAYHGTSLEVLEDIIQKGYQGGSVKRYNRGNEIRRKGDIFTLPIYGKSPIKLREKLVDEAGTFDNAVTFAKGISGDTYILKKLNLPIGNNISGKIIGIRGALDWQGFIADYPFYEDYPKIIKFLNDKGYTMKMIDVLIKESSKKEGIVIGYKSTIYERNKPFPGGDGNDVRVQQILINDIVCIEPLDQESWDYLSSL